ncbi:MAG: hypothetical protein ACRD3L_00625 [Terriglobales bacterium]
MLAVDQTDDPIEDWPDPDFDIAELLPRRDPKVDEASTKLLEFMEANPDEVFYEMQLEVIFEDAFFHWITVKALAQLRNAGSIGSSIQILDDVGHIRYYFCNKNRYWKRKAAEIRKLVEQFSRSAFTSALGQQGEMLVDAGLPNVGFLPKARDVRAFAGTEWTETKHNLDRIFEKDGVLYDTEIKNRLSYISQNEFYIKLKMCEKLGVRPLFIARMMPRSYVYELFKKRGFALLMKYQFYPFGSESFAAEVRGRLALPVDCPKRLEEGTLQRLLKYHNHVVADLRH